MRYRITAWEDYGTLERRHFYNGNGESFTLDIRWSDALFYAEEIPDERHKSVDGGVLLNDLEEFEIECTSDGNAELSFDSDFPSSIRKSLIRRWKTIGDDAFEEFGFDIGDTEYIIFGDLKIKEVNEDD